MFTPNNLDQVNCNRVGIIVYVTFRNVEIKYQLFLFTFHHVFMFIHNVPFIE